jgi:hypothetical protein
VVFTNLETPFDKLKNRGLQEGMIETLIHARCGTP